MKQILQNLRSGELYLADVPAMRPQRGHLVVRTRSTLISAGTERMLTDFARAGLLDKARQQPEKVRQVLEKVRTDGLLTTYDSVSARLGEPLPLGYCNVGEVLAVGEGVRGIEPGDRVASNGPHAEVVQVPVNLCARVPDEVEDGAAAFTPVAAIALQGIRLIAPTLGETVAVSGLGLIGLIAVQMLRANGCRVLGFDPNPARVALAARFGAEAHALAEGVDPVLIATQLSGGRGVDAVLITASTRSSAVVRQSARMTRQRGRIVLTGVVGLELDRSDFYEKEISFQVSCSYGPGRYDPSYEQQGQDYPYGFVRWTEQRNFEAILALLADGRLDVAPLITHRASFDRAVDAYAKLSEPGQIGIVLDYDREQPDEALRAISVTVNRGVAVSGPRVLGLIGAGNFARMTLMPAIKAAGGAVAAIATRAGTSGSIAAGRFGVARSVTDHRLLLDDPAIPSIAITTPHDSHATLVVEALRAGKNVFVEKPLCLTEGELDEIAAARAGIAAERGQAPMILVGFNRRFAPLAVKMRKAARGRAVPAFGSYLVNAGGVPAAHWTQDPEKGGGRIIGEACHFIDFLRFLVGSPIERVTALKQRPGGRDLEDNVAITLGFADGSVGQVSYVACGHKGFPKERCSLFFDGKVLELDNFRRVTGHGAPSARGGLRQDKGHAAEMRAFLDAVEAGGAEPVSFEEIANVMRASFAAVRSMRRDGEPVAVG